MLCLARPEAIDDPSGILKLGKTFIHGFLSLIKFLKAGNKHPAVIFNIFTIILLLVIILKPRFANAIGMHQQSLRNHSGNDATSGDYVDS